MAQIFRTDNPLLGKGLKMGQRFCYLNAMLHFFYGLPRLAFLTAPLAFLFFDARIFQASALMITVYVLPHILHASITNSTMQGAFVTRSGTRSTRRCWPGTSWARCSWP